MTKQAAKFNKISEWVAAGNMETGLYMLERVERQTEKAIGFKAEKINEFGNMKPAIAWFPKSKLQAVENDFYTSAPKMVYLVPAWLYSAKADDGYAI